MIKKTLIWIAAGALLAASCGDDLGIDENTTPSENPATTVDINNKNWPFDQWGDNSVKPGDDFYTYCVGSWYKTAQEYRGTFYESLVTIHQYFDQNYFLNNPLPSLVTLTADTASVDDADKQALSMAYTQQWTERVTQAEDYTEQGKVMGDLLKVGYAPAVKTYNYNWKGTVLLMIMSPNLLGGDEEEEDFFHSHRLDTRYTQQLSLRSATRADDDDSFSQVLNGIASSLGLTVGKDLYCFSDDYALDDILSLPLEDLKAEIIEDIESFDAPYTSRKKMEEAGGEYYIDYIADLYGFMNYEVAHYLYEKQFYDADRQARLKSLCREVLTTLSSRIEKLTWMSALTKSNAKRKVQTMKFFVGYPDTWLEKGLPKLSGNCMVEDVHQLLEADFNITRHVVGKEIGVAVSYLCPQSKNIATDNAFYHPSYNTFFIFPNYMFEPYFREDVLDANLYGMVAATIGHEIVHGFDVNGAKYDHQGNYSISDDQPYGWWQENDYYEYVRRQRLLIDSYNKIPFEPWLLPGAMNDGEVCLGENIADLGGLETALECYTNHIKSQGYGPEAIKDLRRLFFKAYAYSWRTKYNKAIMEYLLEEDVHSSYYARVIGATRNCDLWYDLFDVTQEQNYYLAPAQRCHVW